MSGHGRGDAAFDRWYLQHFDRIRVLCSRILRDPSAAEDMAQEALLRAWMRRDQMREEDLGAWLSVVARNLCLSAIRRDGRLVITDEVPEHVDLRADPAAEVVRRESRRNVRRALGKLGDRNRRVIYLREIHEQEYEDIGSEFGVSAEGARTIAFRARRVLKEHLAAVGEGFSGVLVGVRVRVRDLRMRTRESFRSVESSLAPAMQSGINAVLAVGLVFAGGGAQAVASSAIDKPTSVVAAAPSHVERPGGAAVVKKSSVSSSKVATSPKAKGPGGLVPRPDITAKPIDPDDNGTDITIEIAGEEVYVRRYRIEGDGTDWFWNGVRRVLVPTCEASPLVCSIVYGEFLP